MITRERLKELISSNGKIYFIENELKHTLNLTKKNYTLSDWLYIGCINEKFFGTKEEVDRDMSIGYYGMERPLRRCVYLYNLFETEEELDFAFKYHTENTIRFNPPVELEKGKYYAFISAQYGNAEILHSFEERYPFEITDERYDYGERQTFKTYEEALDYAKKLFLGDDV